MTRKLLGRTANLFKNTITHDTRQRFVALFLLTAFVIGTLVPTASVYAATQTPKQKNVGPIATQKAGYETIPQVEQLAPVSEQVKNQASEQGNKHEKADVRDVKKKREEEDKRTLQSRSYELEGGGELTESSMTAQNYKDDDGKFKPINPRPERDTKYEEKNKVPESFWDRIWPGSPQPVGFKAVEGDLEAYFETIGKGGIRVIADGKELKFAPDTDKVIKPQLKEFDNGEPYILYEDVWPNVDIYYAYQGSAVKEYVRLNKKTGQSTFGFKLEGAKVVEDENGKVAFEGAFANILKLGELSVNVNKQGPLQEAKPAYKVGDNGTSLTMSVDSGWLANQNKDAYPMVIDPALFNETWIPGGDFGDFKPYKSDGYLCPVTSCNVNIGGLNQAGAGARYWRTMVRLPYEHIMGRQVLDASVYLEMTNIAGWAGTYDNRTIWVTWAPCFGYGCTNGGAPQVSGVIGGSGWINVKSLMEWLKNNNVQGGWLIFWGEETTSSYKQIRPAYMKLHTYTNQTPSQPSPELPSSNPNSEVVVVTPTPQLRVSAASDPNGDTLEYYARVRTLSGTIMWESGWSTIRSWVLPEGILQDGVSYKWEYYVRDPWYQSPASTGGTFRVDLRTGKDKTQTYDPVGPLNVSLNTGNTHSAISTHSIGALGGDIGLQLDYNSPLASRRGLYAQYYNNTTWSGNPVYSRFEENINQNWDTGSPAFGIVNNDNFTVKWSGYFVAPYTGAFTFGTSNDDYAKLAIDGQTRLEFNCCQSPGWSATPVNLTAGQVVKLEFWLREDGGGARAHLYVKSNVDSTSKIVPVDWLRTAPTTLQESSGLTGHYYIDDGTHNFSANLTKFMTRQDSRVDFQWGGTAPIPGGPTDNFMVRWEGYFTPPTTGVYTFGAKADDGVRVKINDNTVMQNWAAGGFPLIYGSGVPLIANNPVRITVEYFELTGGAYAQLYAKTPSVPNGEIVDSRYLSPGGKVLPSGWNISADADGNLAYERINVRPNGDVILYDGDGTEHLYTTTGSGYKPPTNEDGILVKNSDYTYTMTDTDGRVYLFDQNGSLKETMTPPDTRKPVALRYNYAIQNNSPKLIEIIDGVDPSRKGSLYYQGDSQCANPPSGFVSAPSANLCAFATSDGQRTDFFYSQDPNGNNYLARIALPGDARYDMGYDSNGMLINIRDVLANDAVAAGIRADDATTKTEAGYDLLSRLSTVTAPAATQGASRTVHNLIYLPTSTKLRQAGASEPNDYTEYIEYDNLLRTTKSCDKAAACTLSEWHPQKDLLFSTTDPTGMKTTTLYDTEDRPTDSYGPAPAAWFVSSSRTPSPAYISKVPRTHTSYDEGIVGPAVAWYNFKGSSLFGAPKLHATGFNPADPSRFWINTTNPASPAVPIQPTDGATNVGFRASAKIYAPKSGSYNLYLIHGNAARVWVDDTLVIDDWSYRSNTTTEKTVPITLSTTKPARLLVEYANVGGGETIFRLELSSSTVSTPNGTWGDLMRPGYGLPTSTNVVDFQIGSVATTTNYGSKPELGQAQSTTVDPTGLNLSTSFTYEPYQAGSLLRQTSKTLPGGTTTGYSYYGATETRDNPCTPETEAFKQAGFVKQKTEADPDGAGEQVARTSETIYDDAGRTVAARYNSDDWTCTTYDARGRETQVAVPSLGNAQGRTITATYAAGGNPLVTVSFDDVAGNTLNEIDLLGRTVRSVDVFGQETTVNYDDQGRVSTKNSPLGEEVFTYDDFGRLIGRKLDNVDYVSATYDATGRLTAVTYPQAKTASGSPLTLTASTLDSLGRGNTNSFQFSDGSTFTEQVARSMSGKITAVAMTAENKTVNSSFSYDKAGRLTSATIDNWLLQYGFGATDASCNGKPGLNTQAGKSGNRTSYTITNIQENVTTNTTYCYDQADRLIYASDANIGTPTYDTHGNITTLAGYDVPISFEYDARDQNISVTQGQLKEEYIKDAEGSILVKKRYKNGELDKVYRYLAGGGVVQECLVTDTTACATTEKLLELPGDVTLTLSALQTDDAKKATYGLKNYQGKVTVSANAFGEYLSGVKLYDPFGGGMMSATFNTEDQFMVGAAKDFSLGIKQYGFRTYIAELGRFLQVDPVPGGTENAYAYVNDPINGNDYNGKFSFKKLWSDVKKTTANVVDKAKSAVKQVVTTVVDVAQKTFNGVKQSASNVVQGLSKVGSMIKNAFTGSGSSGGQSSTGANPLGGSSSPFVDMLVSGKGNKNGLFQRDPTPYGGLVVKDPVVEFVKEHPADAASLAPGIGLPADIYTSARDCGRKALSIDCGLSLVGFIPFIGDTAKASGKAARFCAKRCDELTGLLSKVDQLKTTDNLNDATNIMKDIRNASHLGYDTKKLAASTNGLISESRLKHILDGDSTGGGHFLHSNGDMAVTEALTTPSSTGVINARITIDGAQKTSTMFPASYDADEVVSSIKEAWANKVPVGDSDPRAYLGTTSDGLTIKLVETSPGSGTLTTAYPQ